MMMQFIRNPIQTATQLNPMSMYKMGKWVFAISICLVLGFVGLSFMVEDVIYIILLCFASMISVISSIFLYVTRRDYKEALRINHVSKIVFNQIV